MKALICGVAGQDGAYLAQLLLAKGYEVSGTSRDANSNSFANLATLGIHDRVQVHSMSVVDFRSVFQVISRVRPDEIYNLTGQTSVGLSFEQPVETFESISVGTLNVLEAMRFVGAASRFYNAGSGECFGNTGKQAADEQTLLKPSSPYAVAKAAAYWSAATYRQAYGLYACTGILFNHESPLRPRHFVTRKIVSAACRIAAGSKEKLRLGNTAIVRDWGWAPEYVAAMWTMLQQSKPEDYVIATGASHTLSAFVETAFSQLGLDWRDHLETDATLLRPADHAEAYACPDRAARELGWKATITMPQVIRLMIESEQQAPKT